MYEEPEAPTLSLVSLIPASFSISLARALSRFRSRDFDTRCRLDDVRYTALCDVRRVKGERVAWVRGAPEFGTVKWIGRMPQVSSVVLTAFHLDWTSIALTRVRERVRPLKSVQFCSLCASSRCLCPGVPNVDSGRGVRKYIASRVVT